jgi:hypothetical protein
MRATVGEQTFILKQGGGMSSTPQVKCRCGSTSFKSERTVRSLNDFIGAKCEKCGTTISRKDIEDQARSVAEAALKKSLKNLKF